MEHKTVYFGTKRSIARARAPRSNFGDCDAPFKTLGDKILEAEHYGADLGSTVPVTYDTDETQTGVDVLASPNHDFFDIAEEFGHMVESGAPVPGAPAETE